MADRSRFSEMLAAYDQDELRAAFDACGGYNRTTLNRWIQDGSIPQRGDFVEKLAEKMDDPALYEAWEEAKRAGQGGSSSGVVKAFERLPPTDQAGAFHEIRRHLLSIGKPEYLNYKYAITVSDPPDDDDNHLVLRVDISWQGRLPAGAWCRWVTDHPALSRAYSEQHCIFREVVDFDPDELTRLFDRSPDDQVLAYNPVGSLDPQPLTHRARPDADGVAQFDNEEIEQAHIALSLSYPVPKGTPMFVMKIGDYTVPGPAVATLRLRSRSTSRPRAFAFLPPGRQQAWASNQLRPDELFISLGTAGTLLAEGDGFVLSWTVT